MLHRGKRTPELRARILDALLAASNAEEAAAAYGLFHEAYGYREKCLPRNGIGIARELVPPERENDVLRKLDELLRPGAELLDISHLLLIQDLAERATGSLEARRDTLGDMLASGARRLAPTAVDILARRGDDAWSSWTDLRVALEDDSSLDPRLAGRLTTLVASCIRREPSRFAELEEAWWSSLAPGFLMVMKELGPLAAGAVDRFALVATEHENPRVVVLALEAIVAAGTLTPTVDDALLASLDHWSADVCCASLHAIAHLRPAPDMFIPALASYLDEDFAMPGTDESYSCDGLYHQATLPIQALAAYGAAAAHVLPQIERILTDPGLDLDTRCRAAIQAAADRLRTAR